MKNLTHQKGVALLVFAILLITASTMVAVKALNTQTGNIQLARDKITVAALAQAKDALIGYAITYTETHPGTPSKVAGYLPCPDTAGTAEIGGEGAASGNCGAQNVSVIGRLPWKTLNIPPLRGGNGECLWYVVSGTYKNNPPTGLMNWDTNGQLQVYTADGSTLLTPTDNQAVAIIFAPGTTTTGQNHAETTAPVCGGNYTASNYLDTVGIVNNATVSATANAPSQFQFGNLTSPSSDRMTFITKQDIWNAMKIRRSGLLIKLDTMTLRVTQCIIDFGKLNRINGDQNTTNKSLPWPAKLSLSDYGKTASYNDKKNLYAGRVPYQVDTSRNKTGNLISSDYLLTSTGENCPGSADWAAIYPWWYNWKDHLFYAISERFKPATTATVSCDSTHCLSVNSASHDNAAVVIFAGERFNDQIRTDKSIVSAYLEGRNVSNMTSVHSSGHENYQSDATRITFNDLVYCIKEDLSIVRGTAAGCP
ncbi:MAG: hypothetical protein R8K48_01170 [Gallionella sp.]